MVSFLNHGDWPNGKALGLGPRDWRFEPAVPDHLLCDCTHCPMEHPRHFSPQELPQQFSSRLMEDALAFNKHIEDEKEKQPEKSYQEIARELIEEELTDTIETSHGTTVTIGPWSRFAKTKLQEGAEVGRHAQEIINFYTNEFDELFSLPGDYQKLSNIEKKRGREYAAILNTDFAKLENNFLALVERYLTNLQEYHIVDNTFKPEDIYTLSCDTLILVINAVLIEHLTYDEEVAARPEIGDSIDILALDRIIENGTGVCRHFALLATMLFETIKRSRKRVHTEEDKSTFLLHVKDTPMEHGYNAALKVSPEGNMTISVLDPTYANSAATKTDHPPFVDMLDYSHIRKRRLTALPHEVLPNFLAFRQATLTERDPLIQLFEKYHSYTEALNPQGIRSYKQLEDVVETILSVPTNETPLRKYYNALHACASFAANEHLSLLEREEKQKMHRFITELMETQETILNALTTAHAQRERYEREADLFSLWGEVKGLEIPFISDYIPRESYTRSPLLRSLLIQLSELVKRRVGDAIEAIDKIDESSHEKAVLLNERTQAIFEQFSEFTKPLMPVSSDAPTLAQSPFEYVLNFKPIPSHISDILQPLLSTKAHSYIQGKEVPFLETLSANVQGSISQVSEKVKGYDPAVNPLENASRTQDALNRTIAFMNGQPCAKPIVDICEKHLALKSQLGNLDALTVEQMTATIVAMVKAAYREINALAAPTEKMLWEKNRLYTTIIQHANIMNFLKHCISPQPLGHYGNLEKFIGAQRKIFPAIQKKNFDKKLSYGQFMEDVFKRLQQRLAEDLTASANEQYPPEMAKALDAI